MSNDALEYRAFLKLQRKQGGQRLSVKTLSTVEHELKLQLIYSTALMTPAIYLACKIFLSNHWCQVNDGGATAAQAAKDECTK